MRNCRQTTWMAVYGVLLGVACTAIGMPARANSFGGVLPDSARPIDELHLCQAADVASDATYACLHYRAGGQLFLALFKGGTVPKAVYALASVGTTGTSNPTGRALPVGKQGFDLERPQGVPPQAVYRGTGVCQDEAGAELPCSVFEHAAARQPEAMRYFVYYAPDGSGVRQIDTLPAGRNERALEAELAFQLGQALAGKECCRAQARAYMTLAASLFPDDPIYRAALQALAPPPAMRTSATVPACVTDNMSSSKACQSGP
ncbi:MAG: hypothetical protein JSW09_07160 [Pseudomonadota bacterium]|nr:MAG: hypothetical protein JSW09_07160 [Pseudomonadota bacterium]